MTKRERHPDNTIQFRNKEDAGRLIQAIKALSKGRHFRFMEVCGTHTMALFRYGLKEVLLPEIEVLSGPGCPVCVTPNENIDRAIAYSAQPDTILTTFGDMMKVPGSNSSLTIEMSLGAEVKVVYSALEAVSLAERTPDKRVIFFSIGFETTTPTIAVALKEACKRNLDNVYMIFANKRIPPALEAILSQGTVEIDGLICPGHVSVITGSKIYSPIAEKYSVPCVVAGFEPVDILKAIHTLVAIALKSRNEVVNDYTRVVSKGGNVKAQQLLDEVFEPVDSVWRGLGTIPASGVKPRSEYSHYDVESSLPITIPPSLEHPECMCGEILRGAKKPTDCKLFRKVCRPDNPVGACMVSSEGTCAAYYRYS